MSVIESVIQWVSESVSWSVSRVSVSQSVIMDEDMFCEWVSESVGDQWVSECVSRWVGESLNKYISQWVSESVSRKSVSAIMDKDVLLVNELVNESAKVDEDMFCEWVSESVSQCGSAWVVSQWLSEWLCIRI